MKNIKSLFVIAALLGSATFSYSASHAAAPVVAPANANATATAAATAAASTLPMVNAEVRKVDMENKKITLKHGEIKNLDMPGMTMVFQVKDPAMLNSVKAGDKVTFTAEMMGSTITVMSLDKVK